MTQSADIAIVGGGIVGLAMAREMLRRVPDARVVVFEKEAVLGEHASGRNSGVLHAGFYYAPDSLKAALTRRGNAMLARFCDEHGVAVRRCGKVVVTTESAQLAGLHALRDRGVANGAQVELVDESGLAELEPLARTVGEALWSPTTAVADPHQVIEALARDVRACGGEVLLGSAVRAGKVGALMVDGERWDVGHVVNSAGLYADEVASWYGFCDDYVVLPFKGLYWYGNWAPGRLQRHVYPVPDPDNPFLGVHLTVTAEGGVKVGPTAIPALWREDYGGLRNATAAEIRQVVRQYPSFLTSPHHDVPALIKAEVPKYWRRHLVKQARAMVPSLDPADFRVKGRPGVRAQMWSIPQRQLEMDFVVRGDEHSTHLLNVVSPGWTSAFAVANHVASGMAEVGAL